MRLYRSTSIMWASSYFLIEPLPIEYFTWSSQHIHDYCELNAITVYEDEHGDDLFVWIKELALSAEMYFSDEG